MLNIKMLLIGNINRAQDVYRFSSVPVIQKQSVAEHMWHVSFISFAIARSLENEGVEVDYSALLRGSVLHDIEESLTGDFLRVVKYSSQALKQALDVAAEDLVRKLEDEIGIEFFDEWKHAKEGGLEGDILYIADLIDVARFVIREARFGNRTLPLQKIFQEVTEYFQHVLDRKEDSRTVNIHLNPYVHQVIEVLHEERSASL